MIVNARTTRRTRPTSTNPEFSTEPGAYTFWVTTSEKFILLNFVSIEVFGGQSLAPTIYNLFVPNLYGVRRRKLCGPNPGLRRPLCG